MIFVKPHGKILIAAGKEKSARNDICEALRCKDSIAKVFLKKGIVPEAFFIKENDFKDPARLKKKILSKNPFCIFNLFEGFSEDPQKEVTFVKLLESVNIPFTGNSCFTLSACLDKMKAKSILQKNNLPVARSILVKSAKNIAIKKGLTFPLFIKPCSEDASVGIYKDSLAYNKEELIVAIKKRLKRFCEGVVIEEFLPGKEYSVALLGNDSYEVLGISEIDYSKYEKFLPFLTYDAKWESRTAEYRAILPDYEPKISKTLRKNIIDLSGKAARALACRGYFRVDLRQKAGNLFIMDINPNPDINTDSGYMKLAYNRGYTYEEIIDRIVQLSDCH
ncbi:MAG: ATP-grasp domain-containing protein [Candidatus Omnitrophica bacterium]|jgi:D-alanine-D-alanine ligase|nr:ATP-grasp domain-containing protein [Candidatus Omnitrophota bacterium]